MLRIQELHYMDCDSLFLSYDRGGVKNDQIKLKDSFDLCDVDENHELLSNIRRNAFSKFEIKTLKSLSIDTLSILGAKLYSFECSSDKGKKNEKKGNKKSSREENKLKDYYICLIVEGEYKYLQKNSSSDLKKLEGTQEKLNKLSLNSFDDKKKCINSIKSVPWKIQKKLCLFKYF